jgi:hypothetical protein
LHPLESAAFARRTPEADIATALSERQRSPGHHVDGGSSPDIVSTPSGQIRNLLVEFVWYRVRIGTECPSWIWPEMIMRSLSSFVAPAIAILSTALLCSLSDTAMSQTATGSAAPLPSITVVAPKQVARPRQVARSPQRPAQAATVTSRPTAPTPQTPSAAPDSVQGKLAKLEKASSSCNGGCETSFKSGKAPWIGCSLTGPEFTNLSSTCTDTLTYKDYSDCLDTKAFLGWDRKTIWWHCSSLAAGGKFHVAELKRSSRPR